MIQVSVVKEHTQTKGLKSVDVDTVFDAIRTGGTQKDQILKIRALADKNERRVEKAKLPAITFGGTFSERRNEALVKRRGLMILDFDDDRGDPVGARILKDYLYAMFKSPSGNGYKVLIRIPEVKNDDEYKEYFYSVQKAVPEVDPSGKDIARLCYFSYDEDIVVRKFEEVKVWTEKIPSLPKVEIRFGTKRKMLHSDFEPLHMASEMISNSLVGTRHATILKAGRLLGGYIASRAVDESEVKNIMHTHIQSNAPDDYRDHIRAFNDAIEFGKKTPLTKKEIKEITDEVEKLGTIHVTLDDVIDEMDYRFENGMPKGYKLGWKELDQLYTLLPGSTTYVYSSAYSGKSQFWNEALINLSRFYGMRHAVFSPETGTATDVLTEFVQIYARKYFSKSVMTVLEKEEAYDFIRKHFIVIDGDDLARHLSIQDVCGYISLLERKYNEKVHTITIDPWNELKHHYETRQDLRLEEELQYVRRYAKTNEIHICLVTHVRDQEGQYDKEGGFTFYHMPTFRDISGGQTWSKKGMMMMAVWRPVVVKKESDMNEFIVAGRTIKINETIIQVQKSKPKGYGSTGEVSLFYQTHEHSFKDKNGNYAMHPDQQFMKLQDKLIPDNSEQIPWK